MTLEPDYAIWHTVFMMGILTTMIFLLDWLSSRFNKAEKMIMGEPVLLMKNGKINEEKLQNERISIPELEMRLRMKGVFSQEDVELCYFEVTGDPSKKIKKRQLNL